MKLPITSARAVMALEDAIGVKDWLGTRKLQADTGSSSIDAGDVAAVHRATKACELSGVNDWYISKVLRENYFPVSLLATTERKSRC